MDGAVQNSRGFARLGTARRPRHDLFRCRGAVRLTVMSDLQKRSVRTARIHRWPQGSSPGGSQRLSLSLSPRSLSFRLRRASVQDRRRRRRPDSNGRSSVRASSAPIAACAIRRTGRELPEHFPRSPATSPNCSRSKAAATIWCAWFYSGSKERSAPKAASMPAPCRPGRSSPTARSPRRSIMSSRRGATTSCCRATSRSFYRRMSPRRGDSR